MPGRYTLRAALYYVFDYQTGDQERGHDTGSKDGLKEQVSEAEDVMEYNPEQEMTDEEQFSDEKEGHDEAIAFKSKNGNVSTPEN